MKKFNYKAKNSKGELVKGQVESLNVNSAATVLRDRELVVIELKPADKKLKLGTFSSIFQRVKFVDIVNFTRQLATMINAGLPLTNALSLLEHQVAVSMQKVIASVLHEVESGRSLSEALAQHPKVFNQVYISLVQAGEAAGKLDEMLNRLGDNLEKERDFRSKTKGAMIYPAIVVSGMMLVTLGMIIFVIPKINEMFQDFGAELPFATRLLVGISNFATKFWYIAIVGFFAFIWLFKLWKATPIGRAAWDRLIIGLPIYGDLRKKVLLAEFCRTLGLLVGAGVSIIDGLKVVSNILNNELYKNAIKESSKRVEKGITLSVSIGEYDFFPSILAQMLSVGEETGKVDEVLLKLAVYFETESEQLIKGLTTAIEPLIMVVLGIGVLFLVLAIIMPIYNLTSQL